MQTSSTNFNSTSLQIYLKKKGANQECLPIFLGEAEIFVLHPCHRVPIGTRQASEKFRLAGER